MKNIGSKISAVVQTVLALGLLVVDLPVHAGTLNVTNFGARGDAVSIAASTMDGSPMITVPAADALSRADVGKLMLLFGAGPATSPTNHQDLIATIERVEQGTNLTLSAAAGATSNRVYCTYGTQNAEAFQKCVDAATGPDTVINIPAGNYLLVPPLQVSNTATKGGGLLPAVAIRKGGIQFQGAGMDKTILTGCGAWKLQGKSAQRGQLFDCRGPVTNNYPLVFADLTMDGGVPVGNTTQHGFPANIRDGSGWDETHDAMVDSGQPPLHRFKTFRNCRFTHWRGEILKSVVGGWDGSILVTRCVFDDGNASAFNMSFSHRISSCLFSNLYMAMEFYEGFCSNACYFEDSVITRIVGGTAIALVGALTNRPPPAYTIRNNHFWYPHFAILTTPAQNVSVVGNEFIGTNAAAALGLGSAGYQGSAINRNLLIADNDFKGSGYAVEILGSGPDRTADVWVRSNTASGGRWFAGGYGWSTNVSFLGNTAPAAGLANGDLKGQWLVDNPSNVFSPWTVDDSAGKTNVITYAHGMRQRIRTGRTGSVFALDDSQPEKIPPGAQLQVTFTGRHPATCYFSTTRAGAASITMLHSNDVASWTWVDGSWEPGNHQAFER